jgi:uncharacterized protein YlxW (UPF0749 family)
MAVLVKEKEKVLKQMDALVIGSTASKDRRPTTAFLNPSRATASSLKENSSFISNLQSSSLKHNESETAQNSLDLKKECGMLRKELKKLSQMICDKEKEVEKLKKENFNLLNRCRNNLKV